MKQLSDILGSLLWEGKHEIELSIEYKKTLNPQLWRGDSLLPEVQTKIRKIADAFLDSLELDGLVIDDIILTGSNCNYNWNKYSDVDIHVVFDFKKASARFGAILPQYLTSMKKLWNDNHDIKIAGFDCELYCQDSNSELIASGVYSIAHSKWIRKPDYQKPVISGTDVQSKVDDLADRIDAVIDLHESASPSQIDQLVNDIWDMRHAGLEKAGEFSTENLAFKSLRSSGYIKKLLDFKRDAFDHSLTEEQLTKTKALQMAVDHLEGDTAQSDVPESEKKEDQELISKLKGAL